MLDEKKKLDHKDEKPRGRRLCVCFSASFFCRFCWQDFERVELLGRGAFGEVWRCRHRLDGQEYAVKKARGTGDAVGE